MMIKTAMIMLMKMMMEKGGDGLVYDDAVDDHFTCELLFFFVIAILSCILLF